MFLKRVGINGDIVKINYDEFIQEWTKNIVDDGLERCRGIREPEWHDEEFVFPMSRIERSAVLRRPLEDVPVQFHQ
jgi:hypothetical protein